MTKRVCGARQIGDHVGYLTKEIRNNKECVGHGKDDQEDEGNHYKLYQYDGYQHEL